MQNKMIGHLPEESIMRANLIEDTPMSGTPIPGVNAPYDDSELREMIEQNLTEAKEYTDSIIENFEEVDPTMISITNKEIENILNKWED